MVNKVILVGNLGRDPEMRQAGGQTVAILRLATSRSWIDKRTGQRREEREWHDIEVWGRHGELCRQYLAKGRQVYVAVSMSALVDGIASGLADGIPSSRSRAL